MNDSQLPGPKAFCETCDVLEKKHKQSADKVVELNRLIMEFADKQKDWNDKYNNVMKNMDEKDRRISRLLEENRRTEQEEEEARNALKLEVHAHNQLRESLEQLLKDIQHEGARNIDVVKQIKALLQTVTPERGQVWKCDGVSVQVVEAAGDEVVLRHPQGGFYIKRLEDFLGSFDFV